MCRSHAAACSRAVASAPRAASRSPVSRVHGLDQLADPPLPRGLPGARADELRGRLGHRAGQHPGPPAAVGDDRQPQPGLVAAQRDPVEQPRHDVRRHRGVRRHRRHQHVGERRAAGAGPSATAARSGAAASVSVPSAVTQALSRPADSSAASQPARVRVVHVGREVDEPVERRAGRRDGPVGRGDAPVGWGRHRTAARSARRSASAIRSVQLVDARAWCGHLGVQRRQPAAQPRVRPLGGPPCAASWSATSVREGGRRQLGGLGASRSGPDGTTAATASCQMCATSVELLRRLVAPPGRLGRRRAARSRASCCSRSTSDCSVSSSRARSSSDSVDRAPLAAARLDAARGLLGRPRQRRAQRVRRERPAARAGSSPPARPRGRAWRADGLVPARSPRAAGTSGTVGREARGRARPPASGRGSTSASSPACAVSSANRPSSASTESTSCSVWSRWVRSWRSALTAACRAADDDPLAVGQVAHAVVGGRALQASMRALERQLALLQRRDLDLRLLRGRLLVAQPRA